MKLALLAAGAFLLIGFGIAQATTAGLWNTNSYWGLSPGDIVVYSGPQQDNWTPGTQFTYGLFPGDTETLTPEYVMQFGEGTDSNGYNDACLRQLTMNGSYDTVGNFGDNPDYLNGTGPFAFYCLDIYEPECAPMSFTVSPTNIANGCSSQAQTVSIQYYFDYYKNCNGTTSKSGLMTNGDSYIWDHAECQSLVEWDLPGVTGCSGATLTGSPPYDSIDYIEDQNTGEWYYEIQINAPTLQVATPANCPPNM